MGKIALGILSVILLLASCAGKTAISENATEESVNEITQPDLEDNSINIAIQEAVPLIIGGRQYRGRLGEWVTYPHEWGSTRKLPGESVNCTVDDIDKLFIVGLWVDPENPERMKSLENLELLQNIKELTIRGRNLDKVDFSPVSLLPNLEILEIEGNIVRLPDLTRLDRLNKIVIKNSALESLEGIGAPYVKTIKVEAANGNIDSLAPLNNLLVLEYLYIICPLDKMMKIADMANLPELTFFIFEGSEIDIRGIENLASLETLHLLDCRPLNIEGIGRLNNLKILELNLISDNPSIDFLRGMPAIEYLYIFGHFRGKNNRHQEIEAYQVLNASPLATIRTMDLLYFENLIIRNISALDVLERLITIRLEKSRLYDESEKTRHGLIFEIIH